MKTKIVKPKPFFEISMECSTRNLGIIKDVLWELSEDIDEDQEIRQWYMVDRCDYEGDLEEIIIHNCEATREYIDIIKNHFGIKKVIPKDMEIVFTC